VARGRAPSTLSGEGQMLRRAEIAVALVAIGQIGPMRTEEAVLVASPSVRIEASRDAVTRERLSPKQSREERLVVSRQNGRCVWSSRDGRALEHKRGGGFHFFSDPKGWGYVSVEDPEAWGESSDEEPLLQYFEHRIIGYKTITYFGVVDRFEPRECAPVDQEEMRRPAS